MTSAFKINFVYNLMGSLVPIATALATVPLYIHQVGIERYGIIAIAWLLLGYFGFLDFGLSRASANALSRLAHAPAAERSPVIMTAFYLNLGLGALGGLVMFVGGQWLLASVFKVSISLQGEALAAFPWVAAMLPVGMLNGVAIGVLESRDRFLAANLLGSAGSVLGQLLPLGVAIFVSPTLPWVIPAMLLARFGMTAVTCVVALRSEWPVRLLDFHRAWIRRLFGYGAWVSVSSLISPLLDGFDQMLIGAVLGPAATGYYAVSMNLSIRSQLVAVSLARALFPQLSRADPEEARRLALHACIGLAYGFGAVCGPAILVSHAFLALWIGRDFADISAPVAAILLTGAWVNGVAFIPYSLIQGQGRPDTTAKVHLAEIAPFIVLLWGLMHWYGLPGAAWAWTARVSVDCLALILLASFPKALLWRLVPALAMIAVCTLVTLAGPLPPVASVLAAMAAGSLFSLAGLAAEPRFRQLAARLAAGRAL